MGDPREYEGGYSDDEEILPETEDELEELDEDGEPLASEELPFNDGDEAIEEEDEG